MNSTMDKINAYRMAARGYMTVNFPDDVMRKEYGINDVEHIKDLAASVILTRDRLMLGGSFVRAVVEGNLDDAIGRADTEAAKALKILVTVKKNCHPTIL